MTSARKYLIGILPVLFTTVLMMQSCEKDPSDPDNPYDNINYNPNPNPDPTLNPSSIQGLHKNIFSVKCANPACHDGSFEPDYRTVQSTYSTLVYQPVIKNNSTFDYKYRVVPFDTGASWLHERLLTEDTVLGRMPLYAQPLSEIEMQHITDWIMDGAKDIFGNVSVLPPVPNQQPTLVGYSPTVDGASLDSTREDNIFYNPFVVGSSETLGLLFLVDDDSTAIEDLSNVHIKISSSLDDFSASPPIVAFDIFVPTFGTIWAVSMNTAQFTVGGTYYFRFYANDNDHPDDMEYPNEDTENYFKTYYSFKVVN